jgi:hypothetical protein
MKTEDKKQIGVTIITAFETAFDQTEAERPTLAQCTPYGYRGMESPHEKAVIAAARYARRCGYSAPWTADQLNRRGITRRGRQWTGRAVQRILRGYGDRKGAAGTTLDLQAIFDDLKK